MSLEAFLEAGVDDFGIEDHFDRWFNRPAHDYPVLFVRFDDLPRAWPVLADFVGLPSDAPALGVRRRERVAVAVTAAARPHRPDVRLAGPEARSARFDRAAMTSAP